MICENCQNEIQKNASFCPFCGERVFGKSRAVESGSSFGATVASNPSSPSNPVGPAEDPSFSSPMVDFKYAAFISYRHVPHDQEVAKQVQRAIETYKLPPGITVSGRQDRRLGKCFRDEDELSVSHSLPERIIDALRTSSALIVICSPSSKESVWVQREMAAFIEMHGKERVFAVLASGESKDVIPEMLRGDARGIETIGLASSGALSLASSSPLAADLRPATKKNQRVEELRAIAAVAGCNFDDLRQRDRMRKRKRFAALVAAAIVAIAVVGALAFSAFNAHQEALLSESKQLAVESSQLLEKGDRYGAIEKALEALPGAGLGASRPVTDEARVALIDALQIGSPASSFWQPSYAVTLDAETEKIEMSPGGNWFAVLDDAATVSVFNTQTGRKLCSISPQTLAPTDEYATEDSLAKAWNMLACGDYLIVEECAGSGIMACYEAETGNLMWSYPSMGVRAMSAVYDGHIAGCASIIDSELFLAFLDVEYGDSLGGMHAQSPVPQSDRFFFPMAVDESTSIVYIGIDDRLVKIGPSFSEVQISESIGQFTIDSVGCVNGRPILAAHALANTAESSASQTGIDCRFISFDESLQPAWTISGMWDMQVTGKGLDAKPAGHRPTVHGPLPANPDAVVCSIGSALQIVSLQSGEALQVKDFGAPIVGVTMDYNQQGTIFVSCADGTMEALLGDGTSSYNTQTLSFNFPGPISSSNVEWTNVEQDVRLFAVAAALDDPRHIYSYHLDMSAVYPDENARSVDDYSVEELVRMGRDVLEQAGRQQ